MAMARDREELDYINNKKKENKIMVTGISSNTNPPKSAFERMEWIRIMIKSLFNMLDPGSETKIKGIFQRQGFGPLPAAEVVMDSESSAWEIRKNFAIKKKEGIEFNYIFLANITTVATKVRTAILEAIVKKNVDGEKGMFVKHFVSRPILLIRTRKGEMVEEIGLTFVDALKRYGRDLKAKDLDQAYMRAGKSFVGQMQQTFVVLHEGITEARKKAKNIKDEKTRKEGAGIETGKGTGFRSGFGSGFKVGDVTDEGEKTEKVKE